MEAAAMGSVAVGSVAVAMGSVAAVRAAVKVAATVETAAMEVEMVEAAARAEAVAGPGPEAMVEAAWMEKEQRPHWQRGP